MGSPSAKTSAETWSGSGQKYEAGAFDEDAAAADLLQQYEARIAALERLVGKQTWARNSSKIATPGPRSNRQPDYCPAQRAQSKTQPLASRLYQLRSQRWSSAHGLKKKRVLSQLSC
jgi:hypothetical protein